MKLFDTDGAGETGAAREVREVSASDFARCAGCDALKARRDMVARADGLFLCGKCKGAQAKAGQNVLFGDNTVSGSLF